MEGSFMMTVRMMTMIIRVTVKIEDCYAGPSMSFFVLSGHPFYARDYVSWLGSRHTRYQHKKLWKIQTLPLGPEMRDLDLADQRLRAGCWLLERVSLKSWLLSKFL